MNEERIGTHLRAMEAEVTPDPRFLDALHDQLAAELGLATRRTRAGSPPAGRDDLTLRRRSRTGSRTRLLLLAATFVVTGAAAAVVGSRLAPTPEERDDLLTLIRADDRLRIGIVTDYPQAQSPNGAWGGFDADVAALLAEHLAVPAALVVSTGPDLQARPEAWDVAFPSLVTGPPAASSVTSLAPVYHWPVSVVVGQDDPAQGVADLAGRRVCAVAGSAGAAWLAGGTTIPSTTPAVAAPPVTVVTAADDQGCLALLTAGEVTALVTATIGPADLVVRPAIRSLGPVLTLPMAPVVSTAGADPAQLVEVLDAGIAALRADGTLLDLSRRRFGADLVTPPTP